jgi:hypothetical protein
MTGSTKSRSMGKKCTLSALQKLNPCRFRLVDDSNRLLALKLEGLAMQHGKPRFTERR